MRRPITGLSVQLNLASDAEETEPLLTFSRNHGEAQSTDEANQLVGILVFQLKRGTAAEEYVDEERMAIPGMDAELSGALVRRHKTNDCAVVVRSAFRLHYCRSLGKASEQILKQLQHAGVGILGHGF